jgi:hypothetical protein
MNLGATGMGIARSAFGQNRSPLFSGTGAPSKSLLDAIFGQSSAADPNQPGAVNPPGTQLPALPAAGAADSLGLLAPLLKQLRGGGLLGGGMGGGGMGGGMAPGLDPNFGSSGAMGNLGMASIS